jgi:hypothetical protein
MLIAGGAVACESATLVVATVNSDAAIVDDGSVGTVGPPLVLVATAGGGANEFIATINSDAAIVDDGSVGTVGPPLVLVATAVVAPMSSYVYYFIRYLFLLLFGGLNKCGAKVLSENFTSWMMGT